MFTLAVGKSDLLPYSYAYSYTLSYMHPPLHPHFFYFFHPFNAKILRFQVEIFRQRDYISSVKWY